MVRSCGEAAKSRLFKLEDLKEESRAGERKTLEQENCVDGSQKGGSTETV